MLELLAFAAYFFHHAPLASAVATVVWFLIAAGIVLVATWVVQWILRRKV